MLPPTNPNDSLTPAPVNTPHLPQTVEILSLLLANPARALPAGQQKDANGYFRTRWVCGTGRGAWRQGLPGGGAHPTPGAVITTSTLHAAGALMLLPCAIKSLLLPLLLPFPATHSRSAARPSPCRATLVVCPVSLVGQW